MPLRVTTVRYNASCDVSPITGVVGWSPVVIDLDCVVARRPHAGRPHKPVWPLQSSDRAHIDRAVLDALAVQQVAP